MEATKIYSVRKSDNALTATIPPKLQEELSLSKRDLNKILMRTGEKDGQFTYTLVEMEDIDGRNGDARYVKPLNVGGSILVTIPIDMAREKGITRRNREEFFLEPELKGRTLIYKILRPAQIPRGE